MSHSNPNHPRWIQMAISAALCGVLLLGSGCHCIPSWSCALPRFCWPQSSAEPTADSPPTYSTYVSPAFAARPPRRVVMIEAGPSDGNYEPSERMIAELATQFRSNRLFEVITPANSRFKSQMDNILNGKFHELEISQLARKHNADAVAFVRVNELRGYTPMRASITLAIVDSSETVVIFAVDGTWDTANAATQREFVNHVSSSSQLVPVSSTVQLQSPKSLFAFVAAQIAGVAGNSFR